MRASFTCATLVVWFAVIEGHAQQAGLPPIYLDPTQSVEARVEDLLGRLTLEEKVSMVHGASKFATAAIPRLGIPGRRLSDGPHGVRDDVAPAGWNPAGNANDFATAMPAGICLAATWNPELAQAEGEAIGQEARARGIDVMLGPALNIVRTPLGGRNFEYCGEDPFLASRIAVGYIRGEQSQDVASCAKHFAANNQEFQRNSIDVSMDERTLREIYLPAFQAAVQEAGVLAVMGAYNKVYNQYCCENEYLLNKILKTEWGFKGLVVSDWNGVHHTREAALNGMDLEMGTAVKKFENYYLASPYLDGLKSGVYPMSGLDDKVRRNLRVLFATHILDPGREMGALNTAAHQSVARRVAEEGIVLLKNEGGILPLNPDKIASIAVIGDNALRLQSRGGGSSTIKAFYEITPLEGILRRVGQRVNVTYSQGYDTNSNQGLADRAVAAAKAADLVVFVGGLNHLKGYDCEDEDRKDLNLPYGQDELIQRLVNANPKTIVVIEGTIVSMHRWIDRIPAVLQAWYPGMEGGNAVARVLFGDVNPSGKLPCTIPKELGDSPAHALGAYPGTNGTVIYKEGLLVGYRWNDTKDIEPQFPFGFGLSYTTFEYSNLKVTKGGADRELPATAQFDISNIGGCEGAEIAELYVRQAKPRLPRPYKELKAFKKVFLKPGETQTISLPLPASAFAYYDPAKASWIAEQGSFEILVGGSSRNIRLKSEFNLDHAILQNENRNWTTQPKPSAVFPNSRALRHAGKDGLRMVSLEESSLPG